MTALHPQAGSVTAAVFNRGDYVVYRDPNRFWAGLPAHTFVCRVDDAFRFDGGYRYSLTCLASGRPVGGNARGEYMRLLPPADAMRDIDTAPLHTGAAADTMAPGAVAWLVQQTAACRGQELPRPRT
ncbi:hypothetical protein [Streptomyces albireticuli]|uniref:Uncharacterized protein n=1 Tax=Streptomyces albireticuli TaxID=1940 RepID=A0A2A2D682_9ACTN|nr:hypothetical protein [Streptomyces albireticuli]MCD9145996.1 hypothetical protein [Streptomyces albireticuli]MCD9165804.1 hypothetical protein [Streptomyces albireticuli]MCD9196021.1 hypothetical protein [Streptomyces albireticuli]PAU46889.1 hypothetical protein CK936_21545 [Streptomyces albireticuli]